MSDPTTALPPTADDGNNDRAGWMQDAARRLAADAAERSDVLERMQAGLDSQQWPPFSNAAAFLEGVRWALVAYGRRDVDWMHALVNGAGMAKRHYGDPLAAVAVPTVTEESAATIVDRLRGVYRIPIADGLGPVGGENETPDNPLEYTRTYWTPPIHQEAAIVIERLRELVSSLAQQLEDAQPRPHTKHVAVTDEFVAALSGIPSFPVLLEIVPAEHGRLQFVARTYQPERVTDDDVVAALITFDAWPDDEIHNAYAQRAVAMGHTRAAGMRRALEAFARRHPGMTSSEEYPYPSDAVCADIVKRLGAFTDGYADAFAASDDLLFSAVRGAFVSKPIGGA